MCHCPISSIFRGLLAGRAAETRDAVRAHIADFPRDALAAQLCTNIFGLIGMSGEPGREAAQLAYTTLLLSDYGDDWWLLSVHAQALCEVGRLDEALSVMERSLALNPANANASHFKAHTLYEAGETEPGRAYLAEWIGDYDRRALLHGHLSWHRALWALEQGEEAEMWMLFDDAIQKPRPSYFFLNFDTRPPVSIRRELAAGPGRVHGGVDVERQRVAFGAPGRAHLHDVAVGHLDVDDVVVGMDVFFHLVRLLTLPRPTWACRWCPRRSGRICRGARAGSRASRGARGRGARPRSTRYWSNAAGTHVPRLRRRRSCAP
jgi:hypothetical protein